MSFGNAVDFMGVFSPKPMDAGDIRMLISLGTQYGTRVVFNNDPSVVINWTQGALQVSNDFKQVLSTFIEAQETQKHTDYYFEQGRSDVLSSLKVLL